MIGAGVQYCFAYSCCFVCVCVCVCVCVRARARLTINNPHVCSDGICLKKNRHSYWCLRDQIHNWANIYRCQNIYTAGSPTALWTHTYMATLTQSEKTGRKPPRTPNRQNQKHVRRLELGMRSIFKWDTVHLSLQYFIPSLFKV